MLRSGFLIRARFLEVFTFLVHSRVLMQARIVCVALMSTSMVTGEIVTFQVTAFDRQRPHPANQSNASKQAPGQEFALGLYTCGKCEQTAGSEGPEATARS